MTSTMQRLVGLLFSVCAGLLVAVPSAAAHPHVWVTMKAQVLYAPDGTITGVRHAWTFDDMFSTFALQGLESKQKGVFTRQELQPLAEVNVTSLKEYEYFNAAKLNGKKAAFNDPVDYYLELKDQLLTLHFTLPLKTPARAQSLDLEVFDPAYFVDFSFDKAADVVTLSGAPTQCRVSVARPKESSAPPPMARLGDPKLEIPVPENWGAQFANKIAVKC